MIALIDFNEKCHFEAFKIGYLNLKLPSYAKSPSFDRLRHIYFTLIFNLKELVDVMGLVCKNT